MKTLRLLFLLPALASAQESIERLDPALDEILAPDAKIETLCKGFDWAEGPVWDEKERRLLFSDVPRNTIYQWKEGDTEATVYMKPSGFTGVGNYGSEPGSNGLAMDDKGRLHFCEHGDRRVSYLTPGGGKRTLADNYNGKRFNSPNDLAIARNGDVYFTDPPYGLPGREKDTEFRELPFHGVYRVTPQGVVSLVTRDLDRPNGVALSPDGKMLYVAQSHGPAPIIMAYPLKPDGSAGGGKIFFNCKGSEGPGSTGWTEGGCEGQRLLHRSGRLPDPEPRGQTPRADPVRPAHRERRLWRKWNTALPHLGRPDLAGGSKAIAEA